ncbi:MAG: phosphatidylserine decarboxylase [Victivallales bacterium]|nr:phosphatidylserine decarboxylase [Victivallales bacterium]
MSEIRVFNRETRQIETEKVLGDSLMRLAYETPARSVLSWPLFGTSLCSRLLGKYADSTLSRSRVDSTIRKMEIPMEDFEVPAGGFRTFNEFFTRRVKPGARPFHGDGLCSPADGRLTVWQTLSHDTCIPVKGASFTVAELLGPQGKDYARRFEGGSLCVCRLCPIDYHRFHFPLAGTLLDAWRIRGKYHSVNPIALERMIDVFTSNVREVKMLELEKAGLCAFIPVGAFGVASIVTTHQEREFLRGDECGYFCFGGSTIILVFEPNKLQFAPDLIQHSAAGMECLVKAGEPIASLL